MKSIKGSRFIAHFQRVTSKKKHSTNLSKLSKRTLESNALNCSAFLIGENDQVQHWMTVSQVVLQEFNARSAQRKMN